MRTTAITVSRLPLSSRSRLAVRLPDFVTLMKPRVMSLAVFTALVGLMIAPGQLDPLLRPLQFSRSPRELVLPACSICGMKPTSMP